jgi:hypothetical protein
VNIAPVPSTSTPVAVNTVSGGYYNPPSYDVSAVNHDYYVDNDDPNPSFSAQPPYAAATPVFDLQYDGFTMATEGGTYIPLNASVQLSSGTYHIKVAIADASDSIYDSAVFIDAQQLSCP